MLSCMDDDPVHLYENLPTVKAMWNALQKKFGVVSETRLLALELKLSNLKCSCNKGMESKLLNLSASFTNLQKDSHRFSDEWKRMTFLNSLPPPKHEKLESEGGPRPSKKRRKSRHG